MKIWSVATLMAGMMAMLVPGLYADEWNKKTFLTFSGPVEIPGQVLPPGTYVFKLEDSKADRNIVQVFNKNEDHLYGTFLTIPDYRLRPTGKTTVMFEERKAGSPEAIKAWFYPGDVYGNEFVYPRKKATEFARNSRQSVPSMPDEMESNTRTMAKNVQEPGIQQMRKSQIRAERPTGEEVDIEQEFQTQPSNATTARNSNNAYNANNNAREQSNREPQQMAYNRRPAAQLPKTASPFPLFGLIGLVSLVAAASLAMFRRPAVK